MRVVVQHRSRYHYPRPALLGPQLIRLGPADHTRARWSSRKHRLHWLRDPHGNRVARVRFKAGQAVSELDVLVELAVEINAINPFDFFIDDRARKVPFIYPGGRTSTKTTGLSPRHEAPLVRVRVYRRVRERCRYHWSTAPRSPAL